MINLTIKGQMASIDKEPITIGNTLKFSAVDDKLNIMSLDQFKKQKKIISSVPSIDTSTCANQTKHFNNYAATLKDFAIITISKDLPFAQSRFCQDLKLNSNFHIWSDYRYQANNFSNSTNLIIAQNQLLARCIMILDENNIVLYQQIVKEVTNEPNYDEVIAFIKSLK